MLLEFEQRREAVDRWTRREQALKVDSVEFAPLEIEGEVIKLRARS